MIVCPECRAVSREGTGVCDNGHRFPTGTDEVSETRRPKAKQEYKTLYKKVGFIAVVFVVLALVRPHGAPPPAQAAMDAFASKLAHAVDTGTADNTTVQSMVVAAQKDSGCGLVTEWLVPASALPAPTPGQPSALSLVMAEIRKTNKPEYIAGATALSGQDIIVVGGYACG